MSNCKNDPIVNMQNNLQGAVDRMEVHIQESVDRMEENIDHAIKNMEENINNVLNPCQEQSNIADSVIMTINYWSDDKQEFLISNRMLNLNNLFKSYQFTVYKVTSNDPKFLDGEIMINNLDKTGHFSYKLAWDTETTTNILLKYKKKTGTYEGFIQKNKIGGGFCILEFNYINK